MKTHIRSFGAFVLSCGLFAAGATRLRADEPQAETPKPPAPATEVTVPIEVTGVVTEAVADLNGVLLQVAAQNDSVLGVNVKPVDDVLRSHLGLAEGKGFVVTAVAKESALANADLRVNDVLLTVGGEDISSLEMLSKTLRGAPEKAFT
ncbi:MAG TPA: PDZ domain-containing protein, partial [Pirellulales bacterium]|nr:PDZ domain-containing protein [Pirellulales bacterium]